jgi:ribosomal protein L37E
MNITEYVNRNKIIDYINGKIVDVCCNIDDERQKHWGVNSLYIEQMCDFRSELIQIRDFIEQSESPKIIENATTIITKKDSNNELHQICSNCCWEQSFKEYPNYCCNCGYKFDYTK